MVLRNVGETLFLFLLKIHIILIKIQFIKLFFATYIFDSILTI